MSRFGRVTLASLALATTLAGNAAADNWAGNGSYCGGNTFSTCVSINMSWSSNSGTSTIVTLVMSNQQNNALLKWFSVGLDNMPSGLTYTAGPSDLSFVAPGNGHSGAVFPPTVYAQGKNGGASPGYQVDRSFTFNFSSGTSKDWTSILNAAGVGLHAGGLTINDTSCSTKISIRDRNGSEAGGYAANSADGSVPACEPTIDPPTSTTPEPGSMVLLATGLIALGGAGLRRRRST